MNFEKLDRARIAAALVAAVLTGGAALYGVYVKSREATAASYEVLAPEINELKSEVERIRAENQQLRDTVARANGDRVPALATATTPTPTPAAEGRAVTRRRRATSGGPAPAQAGAPAADAGSPTASAEPPAAPPAEQPPPAREPDVIEGLKKRVPIDFEKAVRVWKDVQTLRKTLPPQN